MTKQGTHIKKGERKDGIGEEKKRANEKQRGRKPLQMGFVSRSVVEERQNWEKKKNSKGGNG